jgi:PAS domain S-box-containing protein
MPCAGAGWRLTTSPEYEKDFFDKAHCALFYVNEEGTIVRANRRAVRLTGIARRNLVGKDVRELFEPSLWDSKLRRLAEQDADHQPLHCQAKLWNCRGKPVDVEMFARATESHEAPACAMLRLRDTRVECLLREQLQRRVQRASVSQERDRRRFARFLHDTAIHDLLATLFSIDSAMTKSSTDEMRRELQQVRGHVAGTIESLRRTRWRQAT